MNMMLSILLILTILLFSLAFVFRKKTTRKYPPHLKGLPLLGYMPFLRKHPHLKLHEMIEKYGPVLSFYLGSNYAITLGNHAAAVEAFVTKGNNFNSRPDYLVFKAYDHETAFVYLDGEEWKETRNFTLKKLKDMGFGKKSMQDHLQIEIQILLEELKNSKGKPIDLEDLLLQRFSSFILFLITGRRNDDTDFYKKFIDATTEIRIQCIYETTGMLSWLKKLPLPQSFVGNNKIRAAKNHLWQLLEDEMKFQKKIMKSSEYFETENLIQAWYEEQKKRNENKNEYRELFSDFNLVNNLEILLQGSNDTTSTTLLWGLLYLALYPEIQIKLYDEIDQNIGEEGEPSLDDLKSMNYIKAFITEVHRKASITPFGVFHYNKVADTVLGFDIPPSTIIIHCIWSIHHDPKYFPEPYVFRPERFLDKNGNFKNCEQVQPFSIGKRICPGKSVAEMQLFLNLISIVQKFQLSPPPGSVLNDINCKLDESFIRKPAPFKLIFTPRTDIKKSI